MKATIGRKKPAKPSAPKRTAPLKTWENYENRLKAWAKKCTQIEQDKKKKEALIARVQKMASKN
jgi:hypothetical protein